MSIVRRILAGTGANAFGQAVTIGIQLGSLPLFLWRWDVATYGQWLLLSAIPAYLSMADVGMVTTAANRMTMAVGRQDLAEANRVFQSAQLFMLLVCGGLALVLLPALLFLPLPGLAGWDAHSALAAMCSAVLIALFGGLYEAVFRATGRYAAGTLLSHLVRLAEWAGSMLGLWWAGSFAGVALGALLGRAIGALAGAFLCRASSHGLHWGLAGASRAELRIMLRPALSFMVFPLANAFSFQGLTLLVGALFGAATVALFNTYRTIARVSVQFTSILSFALWPEFSRLFGAGEHAALQRIYRHSFWLASLQALGLSGVLYFIAPFLLQVWTHGAIGFNAPVMLLMLAYAAAGGLWHVPRVFLMATNQHNQLALWALGFALVSVTSSWLLAQHWQLGGLVSGMLLAETGVAIVCIILVRKAFKNFPIRAMKVSQ